MDEILKMLFENKTPEEKTEMLVNLNRRLLNRKKHIKKYNKLRKLHSEILDSMDDFISSDKCNIKKYLEIILKDFRVETNGVELNLNSLDVDDKTILVELLVYKNHEKVPSVTEIFLEKKKFRNEEKLKMLDSMKNSYASLFRLVDVNREEGYVIYEDVFTYKRFKVIDIAMSSTLRMDTKRFVYMYNRIITYDDISFGTGIHCTMTSQNNGLKRFLKKYKNKKISNIAKCLMLYIISKKENKLVVTHNESF